MGRKLEHRFVPLPSGSTVEWRDAGEGQPRRFTGTVITYDTRSGLIYDSFYERIMPDAFKRCLASDPDIVATVDHDMKRLLGRTSSGTLKLSQDRQALRALCVDPVTSYSEDLANLIKRNDVRGMSFIFEARKDEWRSEDGHSLRLVHEADIFEVSWVVFPAYDAGDADYRGLGNLKEGRGAALLDSRKRLWTVEERDRTLQLVDVETRNPYSDRPNYKKHRSLTLKDFDTEKVAGMAKWIPVRVVSGPHKGETGFATVQHTTSSVALVRLDGSGKHISVKFSELAKN